MQVVGAGRPSSELTTSQWPGQRGYAVSATTSQIRPITWKRQPHERSLAFPVAITTSAETAGKWVTFLAPKRKITPFCVKVRIVVEYFLDDLHVLWIGPTTRGRARFGDYIRRPRCHAAGRPCFWWPLPCQDKTERGCVLPARRIGSPPRVVCRRLAARRVPHRQTHDGLRMQSPRDIYGSTGSTICRDVPTRTATAPVCLLRRWRLVGPTQPEYCARSDLATHRP